jgi:hypothetical protein
MYIYFFRSLSDYRLIISSMATFEYPPAFVASRPPNRERSGVLRITVRLAHHFFLSRLKIVLNELIHMKPNKYLEQGFQIELVPTAFFSFFKN